jgi:GT2 family glycosyltransferase/predicted O-methyltransferase YrrM
VKVSIIIPTAFDGLESRLKPCLESVRKFTDLNESEIIVVKNGCTWIEDLPDCKVLSFDNAIGYPAAVNCGIKQAQGEYVVLLNDDTILLEQPKNQWIEILLRAFWDEQMAIAGPWMNWCPWAEHDFLIFFCVMIRKSVFERIGLLDEEAFGVGYGEDCDLCCKAKAAGFKIAQVPISDKLHYDGRMALGQFPIYHAGNETFRNWPGGKELLRKNRSILRERYGTNIGNAYNCDGFMSPEELRWLAEQARKSTVVIEIGSWHGKSSRAIADNLPPDGKLYCIDTWAGSKVEQDTNHASARWMDGDHAFDEFSRNLWDHIESGKVVPLRMHGRNAAKILKDKGVKADLIFIDAGHQFEEVVEDIQNYLPLRKEGGTISGHDYRMGTAPQVTDAVHHMFQKFVGNPPETTIWYTDSTPNPPKPNIYDCFIFNNELEILTQRVAKLYGVVDRFVIVESTKTHSGNPKELVFEHNKERILPWLNKITYIVVDDLPEVEGSITDKSWARERHQRDAIMRGLTDCKDNDVIIISDVDEIPSVKAIQAYNGTNDIRCFDMDLYYYNHETRSEDKWREAKILPYGLLKQFSPCWARYQNADPIPEGGEHLSYFGGVESIQTKLGNTAHREYDTEYFKDPERIKRAIDEKRDLFDRDYVKFQ